MRILTPLRQGIATTQFFLFGKKHCTQTGYLNHIENYVDPVQIAPVAPPVTSATTSTTPDFVSDGVDLTDKVFIVSGANQGIGKEIAIYAAAKNATVYMLCRNQERAASAQSDIQELTSNDKVHVLLADVSEPSQIRDVVSDFTSKEKKLDCLVCNAGVLLNDRKTNSEGQEITLMSHLVCGSYQLTKLLVPQLRAAGDDSRVVYVSSGGMYNTKFPKIWEEAASTGKFENSYNGNMAYAYAKRGQVLLAERFSKEFPEVTFVSSHPGWVRTSAVDEAYGDSAKYLEPMRTTWQGAEGICWLASTAKKNLESGAFYLDRLPQRKHIAGAFMTDGSFTKNTDQEVNEMMDNMKKIVGV